MKHELLAKLNGFMASVKNDDQSAIVAGLQAVVTYLTAKVSICEEIIEEKTGNKCLHPSDDQKRRLANAGRKLNEALLGEIEGAFAPSTIMEWYRQLVGDKYNNGAEGQKKHGRKVVSDELRNFILIIARENRN